ncbi:DUF4105 domain-containing protein [Pseudomonas sp. NA-150]|uniref:DUF7844 domain-containing protein n=1 Tax=Pseudomonas sp. NA-150 TaxID=3367525 RepID=UPI0037C75F52
MRRLFGWLLTSVLLMVGSNAFAGLKLSLDTDGLSPAEQHASQVLLDEAMQALPPRFIEQMDRTVIVHWADDLPSNAYGEEFGPRKIELNRRLLAGLTDGSAAAQKTSRPHGTTRREMLATVLHELTHVYDFASLWSQDERALIISCQRQTNSLGKVGLPDRCRGETDRRYTLSDDPRLLDLAGWPQYVGRRGEREEKNHQVARSPDIYEITNPREFVAVNMEYFLLDADYACRRPALYAYYKDRFGWAPASKDECPAAYPFLNAGSDFGTTPLGKIDPERVYAVDYLLAEANQNWVSRWGHSMLRLVICKPGRPRGPDCRLDLDQHLVLSYRAFVGDLQLSSWDGLTGVYPSRLFVLPLSQVIDEYTKTELRSLASVPMNLSRPQINDLVEHAAEMHWSYDGSYYFISNNCAVETLKMLRSGTDDARLKGLDSIMPNGLLEVLNARGLADTSVLKDPREALRLGYRFDSYRDRYQAMFNILKKQLPIKQANVEDWMSLPAKDRKQWFAQADLRTSAAILLLEQASFRRQLLLAQEEVKERYLSAKEQKDGGVAQATGTLREILASSGFLSRPAELLDTGGYGLPQASEWHHLEDESSQRQKQLQRLSGDLDKEVRALLEPDRAAEIAANEANVKQIGDHLRALHKAAGGLELP